MHRLSFFALLLLAACGAAPAPQASFRDAGVPIYSAAAYDPAQLAGTWTEVAAFGAERSCRPGALQVAGGTARWRLCGAGQGAGAVVPAGPGRFEIGGRVWWLLWADADNRTLVFGAPDGRLGLVLDRTGGVSADRLAAAREILDWNGYDVSRLSVF